MTVTRGGILVYVRDDIRSRITECENSFEGLVIDLSFS